MSDSVSIERIARITPEIIDAAQRLTAELPFHGRDAITPERLMLIIGNPNSDWLMARLGDGFLVGMVFVITFDVPTNRRCMIENLVVDPNYRGQGIGSQLIEAALQLCEQRAARVPRTIAIRDGISARLLEKHGFRATDDVSVYEKSGAITKSMN